MMLSCSIYTVNVIRWRENIRKTWLDLFTKFHMHTPSDIYVYMSVFSQNVLIIQYWQQWKFQLGFLNLYDLQRELSLLKTHVRYTNLNWKNLPNYYFKFECAREGGKRIFDHQHISFPERRATNCHNYIKNKVKNKFYESQSLDLF